MSSSGPRGSAAAWIAVDWGTSRLRVWGMDGATVLWRAASGDGMGSLRPDQFEDALRHLVTPHVAGAMPPAVACGMVGARQGWVEAPYQAVPCTPLGPSVPAPGGLDVRIVPGLSQAEPPDVMRGEETQIAGLIAAEPRWDGVALLPGTHAKWVQVSAGEVVSFRTAMTGELFALLSEQSVLRHAVAGADGSAEAPDARPPQRPADAPGATPAMPEEAAFLEAVSDAIAKPEALAARLFEIRARALLDAAPPQRLRARLSGLLIGAEIAATRPYWLGQDVVVIADGPLAHAYATALGAQGATPRVLPSEPLTLAGLTAARALVTEVT